MYLRFYVLEALDYVLGGWTEMEDDILGTDMNILVMDIGYLVAFGGSDMPPRGAGRRRLWPPAEA